MLEGCRLITLFEDRLVGRLSCLANFRSRQVVNRLTDETQSITMVDRMLHARGSPHQVGVAIGEAVADRLQGNIDRYIAQGPGRHGSVDWARLREGALPWLRNLPQRFQDELEGMAQGANVPLQRLAEWCFVEECVKTGCSGFVWRLRGNVWVGRNNDIWAPEQWGYVTIRGVDGRIPTIGFGMEAEPFTATGVNAEQLWLHYNHLPVDDTPIDGKPYWPCYVFLTEALETCRTPADVEALLGEVGRTDGMILFAVDGKSDETAVIECNRSRHIAREFNAEWIVATNHALLSHKPGKLKRLEDGSRARYKRLEELLRARSGRLEALDIPGDLIRTLADPDVEQRGEHYGTVYANVACPSQRMIWYTFGGYPAASRGDWRRLDWPW